MPEGYYNDLIGFLRAEADGRGMEVEDFALLDIAISLRWFIDYYSQVPAQPTGSHES